MPTPNRILELDKEHLREIDGVTLDLDSYTRHIDSSGALSPEPAAPPTKESRPAAAAPVFAVDPVHVGWYEPAVPTAAAYPVMAGALIPTKTTLQMPVMDFCGSSSYLSSYQTSLSSSFLTSWMTSYRYGSGSWITSWLYGSGSRTSVTDIPGGFGLELI